MGGAVNPYTAWTRIKDYFLANQGARYLHLTRQYRNLKQGNLSVSEYARRLKALANGLADTGNPLSDHDLTMQLLHGLDNRFDTIRTILAIRSRCRPSTSPARVSTSLSTPSIFVRPRLAPSPSPSLADPDLRLIAATVLIAVTVLLAVIAATTVIVVAVAVTMVAAGMARVTLVAVAPLLHHHHGWGNLPRTAWPSLHCALGGSLLTPPASLDRALVSTPRHIP
ncbi:hypothetical protein D1007_53939 [Hordeum vulgare]|nr:hypothetical protein D1007_53939 [Hordeum vulgare]